MGKNWQVKLVNVYKWSLRIAAAIVTLIAVWGSYKLKDQSLFLILLAGFPLYYLSCFTLDEVDKDPNFPLPPTFRIFFFFGFCALIYLTTTIFWGVNLPSFILAAILFCASTRLFLQDLDRWRKKI